jgi:hypothetical protein
VTPTPPSSRCSLERRRKLIRAHFLVDICTREWHEAPDRRHIPTASPRVLPDLSYLPITMIILLAILAATRASPLRFPSAPHVSLIQLQATSCDDPAGCRSLWDIIRSCIFTLFLCTWASVHPNIPSPDERWPRIALRRVGLMLATLIVPEAMIAWAWRQRQLAIQLAENHKRAS